ncbi:MAG: hypothetical protein HY875_01700 [Chloroflexi bacterium]|nr:hypothetical protein [Chloroflexota bacterium]
MSVVTIPTRMQAYCFRCKAVREHDFLQWTRSEILPNSSSAELRCRACQRVGRYAQRDRPWGIFLVFLGLLLFALPWVALAARFARGEGTSSTLLYFAAFALLCLFPGVALPLHGWRRFLGDAGFGAKLPQIERLHPLVLRLSGGYLVLFGIGVFGLDLYNGITEGFEPYAGLGALFAGVLVVIGRQLYLKGQALDTA